MSASKTSRVDAGVAGDGAAARACRSDTMPSQLAGRRRSMGRVVHDERRRRCRRSTTSLAGSPAHTIDRRRRSPRLLRLRSPGSRRRTGRPARADRVRVGRRSRSRPQPLTIGGRCRGGGATQLGRVTRPIGWISVPTERSAVERQDGRVVAEASPGRSRRRARRDATGQRGAAARCSASAVPDEDVEVRRSDRLARGRAGCRRRSAPR